MTKTLTKEEQAHAEAKALLETSSPEHVTDALVLAMFSGKYLAARGLFARLHPNWFSGEDDPPLVAESIEALSLSFGDQPSAGMLGTMASSMASYVLRDIHAMHGTEYIMSVVEMAPPDDPDMTALWLLVQAASETAYD